MQVFQIVSISLADMKSVTKMMIFIIQEDTILSVGIEPHASALIQSRCRRLREIASIRTKEVFELGRVIIIIKVVANINMSAICIQKNFGVKSLCLLFDMHCSWSG